MKNFVKMILVPAVVGVAFATSVSAQEAPAKPDVAPQSTTAQGSMQSAPAAGAQSQDMQPATMAPAKPAQNDDMKPQGAAESQSTEAPAKAAGM